MATSSSIRVKPPSRRRTRRGPKGAKALRGQAQSRKRYRSFGIGLAPSDGDHDLEGFDGARVLARGLFLIGLDDHAPTEPVVEAPRRLARFEGVLDTDACELRLGEPGRERVVLGNIDIAQARFEFPTTESPSLRTFVNIPETTLPVTDTDGNELIPDIVIVDTPGNILKILAAVETGETVTEERATEAWQPFSKLPDAAFYLYVPVGYGGQAKKICKSLKIDVYGYRTWRYVPQGIEVNEISEPPEIIHKLMPPFARRMLRGH